MPAIATRCIACDEPRLDRQSAVLMPFVAQRALLWQACEITADWGLRSVPTGHALPLCSTLHCPACGMLFCDLRFDDAEMERLYHGYRGGAYTAERERFEPGYAERNAKLVAGDVHIGDVEAFLRPWLPTQPALLDWGGDSGTNTPLRAAARLHHVLDISGKATLSGVVAVDEASAREQRYDLVVLSNVLEHVADPLALLQRVGSLLAAGARLYVEVPFEALMRDAENDAAAWRRKRHWHEHVNFFSLHALRRLLERAALRVLDDRRIDVPGGGGAVQQALLCERG
jgi:hypothetical protein